jgi:hypothetical protein
MTREAMQWTVDALGHRLVGFRNLVLTIGLVVLVSMVAAIVLRSWLPLLGLFVVVTLCGVYWCRDETQVGRWQGRILDLWHEDKLDLDVLAETLLLTPGLPHRLLGGMLDGLPTRSRGFPRITPDLRTATALTMQTINRCHWDWTALATLAHSVVLASLAWAVLAGSFRPILGLVLAPLVLGLSSVSADFRLRRWYRRILPLIRAGLDRREFAELARRLDWGPILPRTKERWIEIVANEPS